MRTSAPRRALLLPLLLALSLGGASRELDAQDVGLARSPSRAEPACLDSIPSSALARVPVYARIEADSSLPESASRSILFSADALLQGLVERVRALLGGEEGMLPRGEPALGDSTRVWRAVGADLAITAYRDGRLASRVDTTRADSGAAALFRRALVEASAAGEFFIWPSDRAATALDSVRLQVVLSAVTVDSAGRAHPVEHRRPAVPVFSMLAPWEEPVRPRKVATPVYLHVAQENGFRGATTMQFVVDSTGRPVMASLRDQGAARAREQLHGDRRRVYDAFVRAGRDAIARSLYFPRRVGGCPVEQSVEQPFGFEFR